MSDADLAERSALFADEVQTTLRGVLPGEINMGVTTTPDRQRYIIEAVAPTTRNRIPLFVDDVPLAQLWVNIRLALDRHGMFLKTLQSKFAVYSTLENTPLVRLEFDSNMHTSPMSHWHVHAERGSLSHLLARAHAVRPQTVGEPHNISSLHIPVGGERFRPCLEDLLQFLVQECGVDAVDGWQDVVKAGRERWRRRQARTVARDQQLEMAETLKGLGWSVTAPEVEPATNSAALTSW